MIGFGPQGLHESPFPNQGGFVSSLFWLLEAQMGGFGLVSQRSMASRASIADRLLGDRGENADWFREALVDRKMTPCIPGRT